MIAAATLPASIVRAADRYLSRFLGCRLVVIPEIVEAKLPGRVEGGAAEDIRVRREGDGNAGELFDGHSGCDSDGCHLGQFDGALTDDMAAEDVVVGALHDEFAETCRATVDDGTGRYRKRRDSDHDVVILPGLRFAESDLGVFGVGEAADRADRRRESQLAVVDGVGGGVEPVLHGLGDQHEPAGDVARGVDVRHVGAESGVDGSLASRV
jgi:hypothetical protein